MDYSSYDDHTLMNLIARSQSEALSHLYDRYNRLVFTVAYHVVGDTETAEEVTQDVFVRVWEGAGSYRPELAKVSSWLISITRHRAIDELRRRGSRPERNQLPWPEETQDGLPVLDGPHAEVEDTMQQRLVRQAISSLPVDQKQLLGLAFFQGYSHSEIARLTGKPLGTVKSRIRLAMHKLRDVFIDQGVVDRD